MKISIVKSRDEILGCFPVLSSLHSDLTEEQFLSRYDSISQQGYQLAFLESNNQIVSVAGFLMGESFAWKKHLYIADMVTLKEHRSSGYGRQLLFFVIDYAKKHGCQQVHLDSRVIRHGAHKFYINQGFIQGGYHFHMFLEDKTN